VAGIGEAVSAAAVTHISAVRHSDFRLRIGTRHRALDLADAREVTRPANS